MRRIAVFLACAFTLCTSALAQDDNHQGIGLYFGGGTHRGSDVAVTYRNGNFPIVNVAWSFEGKGYLNVTLDGWILRENIVKKLDWYLGVGGMVGLSDDVSLSARLPVGLVVTPHPNWEIYGELVPSLLLVPASDFYLRGGVGVRYLF